MWVCFLATSADLQDAAMDQDSGEEFQAHESEDDLLEEDEEAILPMVPAEAVAASQTVAALETVAAPETVAEAVAAPETVAAPDQMVQADPVPAAASLVGMCNTDPEIRSLLKSGRIQHRQSKDIEKKASGFQASYGLTGRYATREKALQAAITFCNANA